MHLYRAVLSLTLSIAAGLGIFIFGLAFYLPIWGGEVLKGSWSPNVSYMSVTALFIP